MSPNRHDTYFLAQQHDPLGRRDGPKVARHEPPYARLPRRVHEGDLLGEVPRADGRDDHVLAADGRHERLHGTVEVRGHDPDAALLEGGGLGTADGGGARERCDFL